ncbi:hypothetical protein [Fimbriiglobus ruber]|uniref:Uncharacterized protein n=1 Tax=Fimbriiglobus ruber TaxID=1908690 RepID=A0A225E465_9BACT|nr:hypothetical protein [Fimbriiglobus ruber]OWK46544.1 hypothetical protein FRUB_00243 [Fimbriiglobus ruber]
MDAKIIVIIVLQSMLFLLFFIKAAMRGWGTWQAWKDQEQRSLQLFSKAMNTCSAFNMALLAAGMLVLFTRIATFDFTLFFIATFAAGVMTKVISVASLYMDTKYQNRLKLESSFAALRSDAETE